MSRFDYSRGSGLRGSLSSFGVEEYMARVSVTETMNGTRLELDPNLLHSSERTFVA